MLVNRYKIIDYKMDVIQDGFKSEAQAWAYVWRNFTDDAVRELEIRVIGELTDERKSKT